MGQCCRGCTGGQARDVQTAADGEGGRQLQNLSHSMMQRLGLRTRCKLTSQMPAENMATSMP